MIPMNPLYEKFPDYVEVRGKRCRIVTDFREWIKLVELLDDEGVPGRKKAELLLQWYIDCPEDTEEAIYKLGEFLAGNVLYPEPKKTDSSKSESEPVFSYTEDAGCIFAAFLEYYGIDLERVRYMHWWKFLILFEGLPEQAEIKQRMMYRKADLNSIKDKDERKRVKEIKKRVALHRKQGNVSDYEIGELFS